MLTTLRIKNLALVEDLTLEFQPGYTVITGETGAGKSILIGALSLALGDRADRTLIREGAGACVVEAVFDVRRIQAPLAAFLEGNGLEPGQNGELVLKRSFTDSGANRQFVNGSPATLNMLASIGEWLVDIHGPHDHQSLLHPARQLAILDAFGGLEKDRAAFEALAHQRAALLAEKASLVVDEKTYAQQCDLLRFQAGEVESAALQPGEDREVEQEYHRAGNAAKILQSGQAMLSILAESESSILSQAGAIGRALHDLHRLDPGAGPFLAMQEQAVAAWRELQEALTRYLERVDVDPQRLQQLEERLNLIHSLKRKYGAALEDVIAFGAEARRKLGSLEQRDAELGRLNGELEKVEAGLARCGKELSAKRRKIIPPLAKAVAAQLADLGFKHGAFTAALATEPTISNSKSPMTLSGFDSVEFQFAPNPGEPARPLRAIASSGELSRVMLALKTVLAAEDQIPVLVFDEVDANVGGETGNAIGEKMRQIAAKRQVLCITHLPQVAAPAPSHFVVTKRVRDGRTHSEIHLLDRKARVMELTRMLGGQTDAARKHAEALLLSSQ